MNKPESVSAGILDGLAATELCEDGVRRVVRRRMRCDCGKEFEQFKLSQRFLAMARWPTRNSPRDAAIDRQIPDGYVPLFCPECESKQLELEARRAEFSYPERYEQDERDGMNAA